MRSGPVACRAAEGPGPALQALGESFRAAYTTGHGPRYSVRTPSARFRNEVEVGPSGRQIQIEDPDGNPIELHEAPKKAAT